MFSHLNNVEMTRRYRKDHDLMGFEADDLINTFDIITEKDIWQLRYPEDSEIERIGLRGIYLSNFIPWDPLKQHLEMCKLASYKSSKCQRTFDVYDHVDCWHFMGIHDHLKYLKNGYSKVLDHACREIRHKRLSRENAINLVNHYSNQKPLYTDMLLEWLGITKKSFEFIISRHTKYNYKNSTTNNLLNQSISKHIENKGFHSTNNINCDLANHKHILFGKGYP